MVFTTIAKAKRETGLSYLGTKNISAKLVKNEKVSNVITYCMYLSPAETSGYNVCKGSTNECRLGCLASSGHRGIEIASNRTEILDCRIKKTRLFFEHNLFFMEWLLAEIKNCEKYAKKVGLPFSIRLNGTSDIDWTNQTFYNGCNIFDFFSKDVIFYDYCKLESRFKNIPINYHLTYSFSGRNLETSLKLLKQGHNVAVVFDTKKNHALPKEWNGYEVIDADLTDYRPSDPKGVVCGLRFKKIGNKEIQKQVMESCFVVKT